MAHDASPGSVLIGEAVARKAGARGIVVIPTASLTSLVPGRADSVEVAARRVDLVRRNLRMLMQHGVRIAVGSDWYGQTAAREYAALRRLGLWNTRELLELWSETTPQSMFPRRRIGRLTDGYEASFLVLRANPLTDSTALSTITTRVKQGCLVHQGI